MYKNRGTAWISNLVVRYFQRRLKEAEILENKIKDKEIEAARLKEEAEQKRQVTSLGYISVSNVCCHVMCCSVRLLSALCKTI